MIKFIYLVLVLAEAKASSSADVFETEDSSQSTTILSNNTDNRTSLMTGKVLYGYKVSIYTYWYAVFLQKRVSKPRMCNGNLILVQVVLTTANCMQERNLVGGKVSAYLGSDVPSKSRLIYLVVRHKIHPEYSGNRNSTNLALGFLDRRVTFGPTVGKIPLVSYIFEDKSIAFAVGWGKQTVEKYPDHVDHRSLKGTKHRIFSRSQCKTRFNIDLQENMFCSTSIAGHFYMDDDGAGLVSHRQTMHLIGLLSYVLDDVAVYIDLYHMRRWILQSSLKLFYDACPQHKQKISQLSNETEMQNFVRARNDTLGIV